MDGRLRVEEGSIYDFLAIAMGNIGSRNPPPLAAGLNGLRRLTRRLAQFNPAARSRRNVAHHYDIDSQIYELFLDSDRQYSCAYFLPGADLEEAQLAKKRHLAAKLRLHEGARVLDIGSGWGGLALYLAQTHGASVTGVTLSSEQLKFARERCQRQGLGRRVTFEDQDYRDVAGTFERIVSVGMFEHVGINHYHTFFSKIADLLADDGIAVVHSLGRSDGPGITNPFIAKYIFPGGYIPALSEVLPAIEQAGLMVTDIEILRLHYAQTLAAWRQRFAERWDRAVALRDERFARMWEFYLAGAECALRYQGMMIFQIQLAKRIDALPITRDYMVDEERRAGVREAQAGEPARLAGE